MAVDTLAPTFAGASTSSPNPASTVPAEQAAFGSLAGLSVTAQPFGVILRQIADLAHTLAPDAEQVSLTVVHRRARVHAVAFSARSAAAAVLDERLYPDVRGPSRRAAVTGSTIRLPDTHALPDASDQRAFGKFAQLAARSGIRSMTCIGTPAVGEIRTSLSLYFGDRMLPPPEQPGFARFAVAAGVMAADAAAYAQACVDGDQMREAMASRASIEQAKGVVISHRHCSPDEAFERLKELSARTGTKVRDVAGVILADAVAGRDGDF
jgi:hypothetical protein